MKDPIYTNDEDRRFSLHIADMTVLADKRCKTCYSDFLDEHSLSIALEVLKSRGITDYMLWGGYENAERVMLAVYPEFLKPDVGEFPIDCIGMKFRKNDELSHRDFLGSLMALGLKREAVGDIVIGQGIAAVFIKAELSPYVRSQISKIGRVGIEFTENTPDLSFKTFEFDEYVRTVSSLRADAVVSVCTGLSRAKAQKAVESGLVTVNGSIVYDADRKIQDKDKISVRGSGKFIIESDGAVSKKGRNILNIKKFK